MGFGLGILGLGLNEQNTSAMVAGQTTIIVGLLVTGAARRFDPLAPRIIFAATFLMSYSWQALLVESSTDRFLKPFGLEGMVGDELSAAIMLSTAGALAFFVGQYAADRVRLRHSQEYSVGLQSAVKPQAEYIAYSVFWIGVALTLALVHLSGGLSAHLDILYDRLRRSEGRGYLFLGPSLMIFATSALVASRRGSMTSAGVRVMIGACFLASLLTGSKTTIGILAVTLVLIRHWAWRSFSLARVAIFVVVAVLGLSMYNVIFRDAIPRSVPISKSLADRGGLVGLVSDGFVGNTFFGLQALMIAHSKFPEENEFLGTYSFRATLLAPVPRVLYPDKPDSIAAPFTRSFLPGLYESGTSIPPTLMGEGFISFGPIGVAAYSSALGIFYSLAYRSRYRSAFSLYRASVLTGALLFVLRGELLATTVLLVSGTLVGFLVLGNARSQRSRHVPATHEVKLKP